MKNLIILNSPPNSGKDAIYQKYCEMHGHEFDNGLEFYRPWLIHASFKTKIIELTCCIYSIPQKLWIDEYDKVVGNKRMKDVPWDKLGFKTMREALIHTSEDVIKKNFGDDYFGKALRKTIMNSSFTNFITTDGGFLPEVNILEDDPNVNVCVVHIERDGCSFENDSRDYIYPTESFVYNLSNNGSREEAANKLRLIAMKHCGEDQ